MRILAFLLVIGLIWLCWAGLEHLSLIPLISHEELLVLRPLEQLRVWDLFRRSGPGLRLLQVEKVKLTQLSESNGKVLFQTFRHSRREREVEKHVYHRSFNRTMTFWRQGGHQSFQLYLPVHSPVRLSVKTSSYPEGYVGLEISRGIPVESKWIDGAVEIEYQPVQDWSLLSRRGSHLELDVPLPVDNKYLNENQGLLVPYHFRLDKNEGKQELVFETDVHCGLVHQMVSSPLHSAESQLELNVDDIDFDQQLLGVLISAPLTKSLDDPSLLHDRLIVKISIYYNFDFALALIAGLLAMLIILISSRINRLVSNIELLPSYHHVNCEKQ